MKTTITRIARLSEFALLITSSIIPGILFSDVLGRLI